MAERPPATDLRGGKASADSFTRWMANLVVAYCQRAKYGHKILLFSSSLTIHSLHFPFLMPLRLTLTILLMLSLSLMTSEQEKRSYWCMKGRTATGTNESRTRTSYRGYPRSQSPLRHRSPDAHPHRTTRQGSQPSPPQRPPR